KPELHLLGHIIGKDGKKPDPAKVEVIKNWPTPKTVKDVRSFLGLASYYRKFMPGFSKEALPMFKLIKKDIQFEWTKDCQEAFERLKELLTKEPILRHPDFNKPFILSTDGSKLGLGAILAQEDDEGRIGVIAYASKTL